MDIPTLSGVTARTLTTARLSTRVLFSGADEATPVIFVHGNASSATYWEETMLALPAGFRGIAPDQRGFGGADLSAKVDATQGLGDLADDLKALLDTLSISKAHFVGHSAGGSVLWRYLMEYADSILSVTLVCPGSPFGFGGTKADGSPVWDDFAGSGGGTVNPGFVQRIKEADRGADDPMTPRNVMLNFYFKPGFKPAREEELLSSLLSTHVGEQDYPGDLTPSANWPNIAPGKFGLINALTPAYAKPIEHLYGLDYKPPILWIRGEHDQIVSDTSFFEMGFLGKVGAIPGYPGEDIYPPQAMIAQTRMVLDKYAATGGKTQEVVLDAGHTPYLEQADAFNTAFHAWIQAS